MTTWTEVQNDAETIYVEDRGGAVWDDGATGWDVEGNVALSHWDEPEATSWMQVNQQN